MKTICVSIASYRDADLINTVRSALDNATHKESVLFSIVSQADDDEHPDLSFADCMYYKFHYTQSRGVCWARDIANRGVNTDFILQVDSHTRFDKGWDEYVVSAWERAVKFWGHRIILTQYPSSFEVHEGNVTYSYNKYNLKTKPYWNDELGQIGIGKDWEEVEDTVHGDEVFFFAGGCSFAATEIFDEIVYDPNIYFSGEEITMAMRAYTRGVRLINFGKNFCYSNYSRDGRRLHWDDHHDWDADSEESEERVLEICRGKIGGQYGVGSSSLHKQFMKLIDMEFLL
jgi:hypothetical protein